MSTRSVAELVRSATVVVAAGDDAGSALPEGSGFFVSADRVVTCAHCVLDVGRDRVWVQWRGKTVKAEVLSLHPDASEGGLVASPDTAVLSVAGLDPHPVVPIDREPPQEGDELYVYGITKVRTGWPEPDGSVVRFEGPVAGGGLYKLGGGWVAKGMSGGAALNLRTRRVCAMTKGTLNDHAPHGGHAVPISDVLAVHDDQDLWAANAAVQTDSLEALRAAQAGYGGLPQKVATKITGKGANLEPGLTAVTNTACPGTLTDREREEWVARQLFTLEIGELVDVLREAAGVLGATTTLEVAELVACCIPVDQRPKSWWVPSDAAAVLAAELRQPEPRIVCLRTEQGATRHLVLWRALEKEGDVRALAPFGSATSTTGLPADLENDLLADVAHRLNVSDWSTAKARMLPVINRLGTVFVLDPAVLSDATLLRQVRSAFLGVPFLVCSAAAAVPSGADDVLLDIRPPIDADVENLALFAMEALETKVGRKLGVA